MFNYDYDRLCQVVNYALPVKGNEDYRARLLDTRRPSTTAYTQGESEQAARCPPPPLARLQIAELN